MSQLERIPKGRVIFGLWPSACCLGGPSYILACCWWVRALTRTRVRGTRRFGVRASRISSRGASFSVEHETLTTSKKPTIVLLDGKTRS